MQGYNLYYLKKLQNSPLGVYNVKHVIPRLTNASVYLKRQRKRPLRNIMRKWDSGVNGGFKREWITEVMTTFVKYIPDC